MINKINRDISQQQAKQRQLALQIKKERQQEREKQDKILRMLNEINEKLDKQNKQKGEM